MFSSMNPFIYQDNTLGATSLKVEETNRWTSYSVQFPVGIKTCYIGDNYVKGDYFAPKGIDKAPLVILVHGMGDLSVVPCRFIAHTLASRKIACFVLYLITHSKRITETMKPGMPILTEDVWFEIYQLSVSDIRQVIDWAHRRHEIDLNKIAVFGISLGGFLTAITMGIDKRIKAGIMVVCGGNTERMARFSKSKTYRFERSRNEYDEIQASYSVYLNEVIDKGFENVVPHRRSFLTDPLTYANLLRGRPVLMFNASRDKYIPKDAVREFWQACGKPTVNWFPAGHTSIWFFYPAIISRIFKFLKKNLV